MDISPTDARDSISLIEETTARTRKAVSSDYAGNLLILWGLILIAGFLAVHFLHGRGGIAFAVLDGLGVLATIALCRKWPVRDAVRGPEARRIAWGIFAFWFVLLAYAVLAVGVLRPVTGRQLGTFLVLTTMLGYAATGLWSDSRFLVVLAAIVTALTLFGYYLVGEHFYLWMTPAGGALAATGLYIRLRWR